MSRTHFLFLLPALLLLLTYATPPPPVAAGPPLAFVANSGQFDPAVRFHARLAGLALWLTDDALWLSDTTADETSHTRHPLPEDVRFTPAQPHPTRITYPTGPAPAWQQLRLSAPDGRHLTFTGQDGRLTITTQGEWPPISLPQGDTPLQYGTFIGGELTEQGTAVAVDSSGAAYITGYTSSLEFPAATTPSRHGVDVYIAKLSPDGTTLDYLLWINPNPDLPDDEDYAEAIAVDALGRAVIAGHTKSPVFCTFVNPAPGFDTSYNGNTDAFLLRVNAAGTALDYCTYLGGNDLDRGMALALDAAGNAYVGGGTFSADFPVTDGSTVTGSRDLFLAKVTADGTGLTYATLIGGTGQEEIRSLALTTDGTAYATGWTRSTDFPTTPGALDTTLDGDVDAFALRRTIGGTASLYSTYLGGSADEFGYAAAVTPDGRLFIAGETGSADFPATAGAFDTTYGGGTCDFAPCPDAFAAQLNAAGNALSYATFLGDTAADRAQGAALDGDGRLYLTGITRSPAFPTTPGAFATTPGGDADAFLAILDAPGASLAYATFLGGADTDEGFGVTLAPDGDVFLGGKSRSPTFPTTVNAFDNSHNGDYDIYLLRLRPFGADAHKLYTPVIMRP